MQFANFNQAIKRDETETDLRTAQDDSDDSEEEDLGPQDCFPEFISKRYA